MTDINRVLTEIEQGRSGADDELLRMLYDELRRLAAAKLANERVGQTLQATALVHEAYIRLLGNDGKAPAWNSRGHFFGAAAEAMRRILVERARQRKSEKRGGKLDRVELSENDVLSRRDAREILDLNDALDALNNEDPNAAELAKLRIFSDLSVEESGRLLGMSRATAYRQWTYARAWLKASLKT